ncbi:MAG: zinc ribbon domain-containing protein [Thermoplasmata archaeon]
MTSHDLLVSTVIVVGLLAAALVGMFLWLRLLRSGYFHRRRQGREEEVVEADRAFNTMVTSEAISRELQGKGFESPHARALVADARRAYAEGNPDEAEALSSQARSILEESLHTDHPDQAAVRGGEVSDSKPVLGKEFPKHFMEAKFLLSMIEGRVKRTKKNSKRGKKARDLWQKANAAYEEEHYSDALTFAVQCRRLLDGMAPKGRKPRPKCPTCGALATKTDDFCGKCGANLKGPSGCRACGAPMEEEDRFCRKCGVAAEVLAPVP